MIAAVVLVARCAGAEIAGPAHDGFVLMIFDHAPSPQPSPARGEGGVYCSSAFKLPLPWRERVGERGHSSDARRVSSASRCPAPIGPHLMRNTSARILRLPARTLFPARGPVRLRRPGACRTRGYR